MSYKEYEDILNKLGKESKSWECQECYKDFGNKGELIDHLEVAHDYDHSDAIDAAEENNLGEAWYTGGVGPYFCYKCNRNFKGTPELNAHDKKEHANETEKVADGKDDKCPVCGIINNDPEEMKKHIITHAGIKESVEDYDEGKPLSKADADDWREDETYNEFKARRKKENRPLSNAKESTEAMPQNPVYEDLKRDEEGRPIYQTRINDVLFGPVAAYKKEMDSPIMTVKHVEEQYTVEFLKSVDPDFSITRKALESGYARWVNQSDTDSLDSLVEFIGAGSGSLMNAHRIMCPTCFGLATECDVCFGKREIDIQSPSYEVMGQFSCPYDGSNFAEFGDLIKHTLGHNQMGSESSVKCPICKKDIDEPIKVHIMREHDDFSNKEVKKKTIESDEKECKYGCGFKTQSQDELDDHERGHRGAISESDIRCKYCDTPFGDEKTLTKHLQMYQGDKDHPKLNSGKYVRNESLDLEKWLETQEKQDKVLSLEEAIKALSESVNWVSCEICGKDFPEDEIKEHEKSHSSEESEDSTDSVNALRNIDNQLTPDEIKTEGIDPIGIIDTLVDPEDEKKRDAQQGVKESEIPEGMKKCDRCLHGWIRDVGEDQHDEECPKCDGTGYIKEVFANEWKSIVDLYGKKGKYSKDEQNGYLDHNMDEFSKAHDSLKQKYPEMNSSNRGYYFAKDGPNLNDTEIKDFIRRKNETSKESISLEGGPGSGKGGHEPWMRGVEEFTDLQYGITGKPNGTTHRYCDNCMGVRNIAQEKCTICGKANFYKDNESFEPEPGYEKKEEKDFKCGYCGKDFDFNDEREKHERETGHDILSEESNHDDKEEEHKPYELMKPKEKLGESFSKESLYALKDETGIFQNLDVGSADSELYKVEEWYNGKDLQFKEKLMENNMRDLDDAYKGYESLDEDLRTIIYTSYVQRNTTEKQAQPITPTKHEKFDDSMMPLLSPPEEYDVVSLSQNSGNEHKVATEAFTLSQLGEEDG